MVAVADFTGTCPRCGGDQSWSVVKPERFACVYCGWRCYGDMRKLRNGEGRVLRLRYLGPSTTLRRYPTLAALMVPGGGTVAQSRLGLKIACPLCREDGTLSVMERCGRSLERWRCAMGHELRVHRLGREELVGWS